ncbi:MAG: 5-(carboxyamino)imidazole ribonucleotide synthase [Flavobacteriaceae bacterium]|jgi:5-(carboxyamino)imidazole ribonucleotide synthase|nr:5-(carboxyamino)imidazole ribonucleotide synthase [Flavobacteriaceae bacterium]
MKIGILGGGQLGRMLMQNALNYPFEIYFLESDPSAPCSVFKDFFTQGDFKNYQTVLDFGKDKDIVGIEIENVNIQALKELQKKGTKIIPSPDCLEIIKDKGLQKQFYQKNNLPTLPFFLVENKLELLKIRDLSFPLVQKLRIGGYDGKGVQIIHNQSEIENIWDESSVIEEAVEIKKELSVIVSKNEKGETRVFDVVEMVFDPKLNLVDYLFSPAEISPEIAYKSQEISLKAIESFQTAGIFCVELFLTKNDEILINEIAPRVHNSGHQTIEAGSSSQYDQMLRVLANLPLGEVRTREFSAMINLVGELGNEGIAHYDGIEKIVSLPETYVHLYGKKITKPGRKMGHVTVLGENKTEIEEKIHFIKSNLKIIAK